MSNWTVSINKIWRQYLQSLLEVEDMETTAPTKWNGPNTWSIAKLNLAKLNLSKLKPGLGPFLIFKHLTLH